MSNKRQSVVQLQELQRMMNEPVVIRQDSFLQLRAGYAHYHSRHRLPGLPLLEFDSSSREVQLERGTVIRAALGLIVMYQDISEAAQKAEAEYKAQAQAARLGEPEARAREVSALAPFDMADQLRGVRRQIAELGGAALRPLMNDHDLPSFTIAGELQREMERVEIPIAPPLR